MILLYIDPGTGSMLFSVLLGVFTACVFGSRKLWIKIKMTILGGKVERINKDKIPVVIFSDSKRYWNTFEPICNELEKRGIQTEYWTESEDDPAFLKTYEFITCRYIGNLNKAITKLNVMNAYICLATTPGLDVYQWKRSKNTDWYVHIFHSVSCGVLYRMFGLDFYDAIALPGDFTEENIRKLEQIRMEPAKECVRVGLPYLDVMDREVRSRSFEKTDKITVLVAPTWGVNSLFNQLGDEFLDALIETGYNIVIRPHPQSYTAEADLIDRLMKKYPEGDRIHWNSDNDNINALGCSDILISDYSGVLYDYALVFDKPVIYSLVELNKSPYDAWFLDEDPQNITVLSRMGIRLEKEDIGNIKSMIDNVLNDENKASEREYVRQHFWYNHGQSAIDCVDYIEKKIKELKEGE